MLRITIFLFFLVILVLPGKGQTANQSGLSAKTDSSSQVKNRKFRSPKTASLLSAVLPGAGQIYNGRYWKLPILYGGGFALGYYINLNNSQYKLFRDSYLKVKAGENDYFNGNYDAEQLARLREYWRRNRDLLIIVSGLTYLLNIADAAVDAHFSTFDVSDDLSLKISPGIMLAGTRPAPVIGLKFDFH